VPIDPAPFLSTIILASAGLVAIVGGLLVARFVSLDSDQQASRNVLTEAQQRHATAQRRRDEARKNLAAWYAQDFLAHKDVRYAIGEGITDLAALRKLGDCALDDKDLAAIVAEAAAEFEAARQYLSAPAAARRIERADYKWRHFRLAARDLPEQRWPRIWRDAFDVIAAEQKAEDAKRRRAPSAAAFDFPSIVSTLPSTVDYGSILARRKDELATEYDRAQQRAEDYDEELSRLQAAHAEIVRPDSRLWWGVAILVGFTIAGVGIPAWLMAFGPADLARVRWVFFAFAAVLAALLIYIGLYLYQLTRHKDKPTAI